jgi:hypothetical protein
MREVADPIIADLLSGYCPDTKTIIEIIVIRLCIRGDVLV